MKTKRLLMITLLAACIIPSISHADEGGKGEKKAPDPVKVFNKFDADQSGSLSSEEVAKNKGLTKRFEKLDKDEDGELSLEEFKAGMVKKPKKAKKAKAEDSDEDEE